MSKSSKNNMKNWLHMHLPKVTKTTLGPLGVKLRAWKDANCDSGLEAVFFFLAKKCGRMNASWFISGGNHSHLLQRALFSLEKKH
jgi:hypothetical protein